VTLSERDSAQLYQCVHRGHTSVRTRTRAQVLRKLGDGWSEAEVFPTFDVCLNAVKHIRQRRGVEQCVVIQRNCCTASPCPNMWIGKDNFYLRLLLTFSS
jgi:hypothetical protein